MFPNFLRRFLLITEVAVNVVRKFLDSKYHPDNFETFLEKNKNLIYHLQGFKKSGCCTCFNFNSNPIIYKEQFQKLFIKNGKVCPNRAQHCHCMFKAIPNIQLEDIDLTLIGTLLNTFCTLDQQQEQSVTVIRKIRNESAHYSHNNDIDEKIFCDSWCKVSDATEHLALCIGENYVKEILDQIRLLKARTLSPVEYTDALQEINRWLRDQNENDSKILNRLDSMEKTLLEGMKNRTSIENRPTTEEIDLEETNCKTEFLDISVSPAEAYIIPGNNHIIQFTVTGEPTATSIEWRFTPNGGNQRSLNIGGWDGKYTGGCTQNPSLTIKNLQPTDAGSYVCYASTGVDTFSCNYPSVLKYGQFLDISVSPAEAYIIPGNNHIIQCTVTGEPTATSIEWRFTPNGGNQRSLNIGGWDGKYTGGCTQNPSLTIKNLQPTDAGSYVCYASTDVDTFSCNYPSVLKYGRQQFVETDLDKRIDEMRVSGEKERKPALSYSLLVYAALRGSISLGQEHSDEFTEIAKTVYKSDNDSDYVLVSPIKYTIETKLVPDFLSKVNNRKYSPRDNIVVKSIIHSFGKKFKTCLLKFCNFDILFDHVCFTQVNKNGDLLEFDSEILVKSLFQRIQFDKYDDAYLIGQHIGKLGTEINTETLNSFVDILRIGHGAITFYNMDSFIDGLTKKGTNFDVFRKLPALYDAFKRKVDNYGNTIFHYIVAHYPKKEKYKMYMQHFCEKRFVLLQLENCDKFAAIDFASLLGRKEVIALAIRSLSLNRTRVTNRIFEMVKRGVENWQMPNARLDNLIKISLNNVAQGSSFDYAEIIRLIKNDSEAVDDAVRILNVLDHNIPVAVSAISALFGVLR